MGHLDDPANTFWEEFTLPSGADQWVERTPVDVADNGGLVTAPTSDGVVVGFRPSADLKFSPLASTSDGGATYTPGLLSDGLANVPDALSVTASGHAAALTSTQVMTSARDALGVGAGHDAFRDQHVVGRASVRRATADRCARHRERTVRRGRMLVAWRCRVARALRVGVRVGRPASCRPLTRRLTSKFFAWFSSREQLRFSSASALVLLRVMSQRGILLQARRSGPCRRRSRSTGALASTAVTGDGSYAVRDLRQRCAERGGDRRARHQLDAAPAATGRHRDAGRFEVAHRRARRRQRDVHRLPTDRRAVGRRRRRRRSRSPTAPSG